MRSCGSTWSRVAGRGLIGVVIVLVTIALAGNSVAQPICTITWDGGAGTDSWHDAANWSGVRLYEVPGGHAPWLVDAQNAAELITTHSHFATNPQLIPTSSEGQPANASTRCPG